MSKSSVLSEIFKKEFSVFKSIGILGFGKVGLEQKIIEMEIEMEI